MARRSDLIFDVGLHKGEDTDFYLKKGYSVVAFEANPDLVAYCTARFRAFIACGRLHVVEGAIAPEAAGERIVFYKNLQKSVWGTIDPTWVERNRKLGSQSVKVEVARTDLAEAFRAHGMPLYVKIDIEGADNEVLDAMQRWDDRPLYVSIEADKTDFSQLSAQLNALQRLGYTAFKAVQQAMIPGARIVTTTCDGEAIQHVFADGASGPFGTDLSGRWLSYDECLRRFRTVFRLYRLFGDDSALRHMRGGEQLIRGLGWLCRRPLPGWYDIHARLGPPPLSDGEAGRQCGGSRECAKENVFSPRCM